LLFPLVKSHDDNCLRSQWGGIAHPSIRRNSSTLGNLPVRRSVCDSWPFPLLTAPPGEGRIVSLLVFCRPDGEPLTLRQLFATSRVGVQGGGTSRVRWHDLRHSLESQLAMAGVPLRWVQVWFGHSSIVTTQRYVHLAPGGGREFIAALEPDGRANLVQAALAADCDIRLPKPAHYQQANDIKAVVKYFDRRFNIGFTSAQKADLEAFLRAL
jgi:hypothetical protein